MRFTPSEFAVLMASTDAATQQFMYALNHTITLDLSQTPITNGLEYLVTKGFIDPSRVPALLAVPGSIPEPGFVG